MSEPRPPAPSWTMRQRLAGTRADRAAGRPQNPHHVCYAVEVGGPLDVRCLVGSWRDVVGRHPALRTRFDGLAVWAGGGRPPDVREVEADSVPAARTLLEDLLAEPMDLERGPLTRLVVCRVGRDRAAIGLAAEHVVCDGWSLRLLVGQLWEAYRRGGRADPPPDEAFALIEAENARLAGPDAAAAVARRLADLGPPGPYPEVRLPGLRPGGGADQSRTDHHPAPLPAQLPAAVRRATRAPLSVVGVLHAAVAAGLHVLSGQPTVGTVLAHANRASRPSRSAVGWLADNVTVRSAPEHDPRSAGFLREHARAAAPDTRTLGLPLALLGAASGSASLAGPAAHPWVGYNPTVARLARPDPGAGGPLVLRPLAVSVGWNHKPVLVSVREGEDVLDVDIATKPAWYGPELGPLLASTVRELLAGWAADR